MPFHDRFMLPGDDRRDADAAWFDKQKQRIVQKNNATLRGWLAQEVNALRAFHDGHASADETAPAITRPVSISPVLDLGGYSDEIFALNTLWIVIIAALVESQIIRTPDLFALLDAIAKVPDKIHNGKAADDSGRQLTWDKSPYFCLNWPDDLQPGQIWRGCSDEASLASCRRLYLRIKNIEAQLAAKHVLGMSKQMKQYVIRALEKNIDDSDRQVTPDEAA